MGAILSRLVPIFKTLLPYIGGFFIYEDVKDGVKETVKENKSGFIFIITLALFLAIFLYFRNRR